MSVRGVARVGKEGWLSKRGAVVNNWKRRYVVLESGLLKYFKSPMDQYGQPQGQLDVRGARVLTLDEDDYGKANAFAVTPKFSGRTYIFVADTEDEQDEWVGLLSRVGVVYGDNRYSDADGLASKDAAAAAAAAASERSARTSVSNSSSTKVDPRSVREGFLEKQGAVMKNWKKRYWVLFTHTLQYFKHKGDVVPAGEIPLRMGAEVRAESGDVAKNKSGFVFSVTPNMQSLQRKYLLVAATDEERQEWIADIRGVLDASSTRKAASSESQREQEESVEFDHDDDDDDDDDDDEHEDHDDDDENANGDSAPATSSEPSSSPSPNPARSSQSSTSATAVQCIKEGTLMKQGGFVKNWKQRYWVLETSASGPELKYYRDKESMKLIGDIVLTDATVVQQESTAQYHHDHVFSVTPDSGGRKYVLVAASEAERLAWMDAIARASKSHGSQRNGASVSSSKAGASSGASVSGGGTAAASATASASASSLAPADDSKQGASESFVEFRVDPDSKREGWITKLSNDRKQWRKTYFVLTGHSLVYFPHKPTKEQLSQHDAIDLHGCLVRAVDIRNVRSESPAPSNCKFAFVVQPHMSQQEFVLCCFTQQSRRDWIHSIRHSVSYLQLDGVSDSSVMEGYLSRLQRDPQRPDRRKWIRQYYVINSDADNQVLSLKCFATQQHAKSAKPLSEIVLEEPQVQILPNDRYNKANSFSISVTGAGSEMIEWICAADLREEVDVWIEAVMAGPMSDLDDDAEDDDNGAERFANLGSEEAEPELREEDFDSDDSDIVAMLRAQRRDKELAAQQQQQKTA